MKRILLFLVLVFLSNPALAFTCAPPNGDKQFEQAAIIFKGERAGTLPWLSMFFTPYTHRVTYKVSEVYKGEVGEKIHIYFRKSFYFPAPHLVESGVPVLVMAQQDQDGLYYFQHCRANTISLDPINERFFTYQSHLPEGYVVPEMRLVMRLSDEAPAFRDEGFQPYIDRYRPHLKAGEKETKPELINP